MSELARHQTNPTAAAAEGNKSELRETDRTVVAVYIFSSDGKLLLGKQDPTKGGTYLNAWRLPGGGVKPKEELDIAIIREGGEEVIGLDLTKHSLTQLSLTLKGADQKTLPTGETVWQRMDFYHFEARLDKTAAELELELQPGDDLVELGWFEREELPHIQLIPGGRELMIQAGYIDSQATQ